uniref:S1 motif domain-containing protein n=1 Tax=Noctiluca scintillans TaxID=2966 RepID=A0A7S1ALK5_NOCSC
MWRTPEIAELAGSVSVERVDGKVDGRPVVPEIVGLRPQVVCPGDLVTAEPGTLRGRGVVERDGKLVATTCGIVETVNKLMYVRPLKHKYPGNVGDIVVGRILEVQSERWLVEIGTAMHATLHLTAVHLPGNVQRRRTDEDATRMRDLFVENDVISAEVQRVHESGEVALQTRTARYGKLQNGVLAAVPSVYIRRQLQHFVVLPDIGVMVVLGSNGWVWVCAPPKVAGSGRHETINFSQMDVRYDLVSRDVRLDICRVKNAVLFLANLGFEVTPESLSFTHGESVKRGMEPWELLDQTRSSSAGLVDALVNEALNVSRNAGSKQRSFSQSFSFGGEGV